jgi:hypothetical protein
MVSAFPFSLLLDSNTEPFAAPITVLQAQAHQPAQGVHVAPEPPKMVEQVLSFQPIFKSWQAVLGQQV